MAGDPFAHLLELEILDGWLVLYHATRPDRAADILANGFTDSTGTYGTGLELTGVFVSNRPLDMNEGAKGGTMLRVLLPTTDADLDVYELKQDPDVATYREWCLPATLLNSKGRVERAPEPAEW